jgi:two-component system response regulator DesR
MAMSTATAARSLKVFLADDSAPIRTRIAQMLHPAVAIVGEGETPRGCIDGILATHPHVVVLDVQLAGGQGLEVLRAVRAAQPGIAFVVFSNNSQPAYRRRYLAAGATRFLDKSTEFDQLAAAVTAAPRLLAH